MKHEKLTSNKFLNLFKVTDQENGVSGYLYAERFGKDSIAFICIDREKEKFLLNMEYKPPVGKFITGAFGGSLDKDGKTKTEIVIEEVREEAGYEVSEKDVCYVGDVFVSTQMNQFCSLYLVDITHKEELDRKPENEVEANSQIIWFSEKEVIASRDWKAITIMTKAKQKLGLYHE